MTGILYFAAAWCALAVVAGLVIAAGIASAIRHDRFIDSTPSPCERDAQDGRGEVAERCRFRTIHNGSNSTSERSNHA